MSFFNDFYTKPGPGIPKDMPSKKGIKLYFEIFLRHFWDLLKLNFIYVIFSIPMAVLCYVSINYFDIFSLKEITSANGWYATYNVFMLFVVTVIVIICGSGPASAAMSYIMNCYINEKPTFLWLDFKEFFGEKLKQGILISVADILLITILMPFALRFYYIYYLNTMNNLFFIVFLLILIATVIYVIMHIYLYHFMMNYDIKLYDVLKNSLIMTLAYMPQNLILILLQSIIVFMLFSSYNVIFITLMIIFFLFAFMRFPLEFFVAGKVKNIFSKMKTDRK